MDRELTFEELYVGMIVKTKSYIGTIILLNTHTCIHVKNDNGWVEVFNLDYTEDKLYANNVHM